VTDYRADQVGSLLRPPELLGARERHASGQLDDDGLRQAEDRAILDALRMQRDSGIDVVTDGEFRRGGWMTDMADAVDGFVPQSRMMEWQGPNAGPEPSISHVVGARLQPRRRLTGNQAPFLVEHAGGPTKVTVPAPDCFLIMSYAEGVTDQVYRTRAELLKDVSAIIHDELAALVADGVSYVQLDTPQYSYYCDEDRRRELRETGIDPDRDLELAIAADNEALAGLDRSRVTVGLHICRGNSRSRWVASGGYEPIADRVFPQLDVDRFLLEYDTDRAGGFEPLRFVPDGKIVVLGLVTTKQPELENRDFLARRVEEASKYVPLERLTLSPQCGFASVASGNLLSIDDERRKLDLVVETARLVWG
jgi:5-methyltetrahydropteroyltriglutamate--homocysteine methyltransferase